jgi:hypothetical protein
VTSITVRSAVQLAGAIRLERVFGGWIPPPA